MNDQFATAMRRALEHTRAGDPRAATTLLQRALSGRDTTEAPCCGPCSDAAAESPQGQGHRVPEDLGRGGGFDFSSLPGLGARSDAAPGSMPHRARSPRAPVPDGARVEARTYRGTAGGRSYRLFVPSDRARPKGVLVMLHGCTQTPEDFALGTRMDQLAERAGFVVAYPEQTGRHNAQSCWNWFRPEDQGRTHGEAAILAGLGQALSAEFDCPGRVFAAGLSAGGAMAAILGESHPEVFAAVGVHSGLPAGAARDMPSAFAAMRGDVHHGRPAAGPVIVFHGTADRTVAPGNADAIVTGSGIEQSESGNGRSWTRLVTQDGSELWRVAGAGHAWFGGDPAGSYADPTGPDASAEMLRFFMERGRA
ncbi:Esterase PHB depolymerase [Roseivivax jejudonensis]|uniref:Esterase PHB depolymerase n=1 Tax=Roseivivax jejudonensis TaxID=1529041 RepID=A0A1X6ZZJ7_9RHOB|nr:PHB depolymerase family esterase [Roseivivax jejudonensis]SLN65848.1 Esterase PHB depolymerase [Roseivivax jejudonensis]